MREEEKAEELPYLLALGQEVQRAVHHHAALRGQHQPVVALALQRDTRGTGEQGFIPTFAEASQMSTQTLVHSSHTDKLPFKSHG